jgi:glycine betaine/proline transport system ATP-binding protein
MVREGRSKDEILEQTHNTVGVADATFNVKEGEIGVIMGLSGSGKSTLVRCVNRLIEPTAGSVMVDGVDVLALNRHDLMNFRREHFGMVFQHFALFPHRTVIQNVEFGLEVQGVEKNTRKEKAMQSLDLVGLGGYENSYPDELSGGMQQRVGLARALTMDPGILLMDEAFSALDPLIRREMQDELISLQKRVKKTILFITHDLDEALKLGDRIFLMKDGYIVQDGTGEEILTNPATRYVEKFVEDVDMSKVVTIQTIMRRPKAVAYASDGPRVVLRKMDEEDLTSIFVLDREHRVRGKVHAEDLATAIKNNDKTLDGILATDISMARPDMVIQDLFSDLASYPHPIGVLDEEGRLLGEIGRGTLLHALDDLGQLTSQENIGMPDDGYINGKDRPASGL